MTVIPDRLWELWILCFWWSSWTLADQYLIPFHPWSELIGLALCASVWLFFTVRDNMPVVEEKVSRELASVTQTQGAGPYARQTDEGS